MSRSQSPRSPGEEDEAKEEEGLFSGRSGEAGAKGHERHRTGKEELGGREKAKINDEPNWAAFYSQGSLLFLQENGDLKYADLKIRRWDKSLEKPQLDYSEYYMEDVGQVIYLYVLSQLQPTKVALDQLSVTVEL